MEAMTDAALGAAEGERMLVALRGILDEVEACEAQINAATARRTRLIEQAAGWAELVAENDERLGHRPPQGWSPEVVARRTVSSELAVSLHVPERSAQNLVEAAKALVRDLPETLAAMSAGTLSYRRAERIVDQSYTVPDEAKAVFDHALATIAPELTAGQIEDRARRLREKLHPEPLAERTRHAVENRTVGVDPAHDGMAYLTAFLPAEQAMGIHTRVTDLAYELRRSHPDEKRTLAQLRADALADLLLDGEVADDNPDHEISENEAAASDGSRDAGAFQKPAARTPWKRGIRPRVLVTVPVLTLLGVEEMPASLDGYGPIAPDVARELAAHAPSFTRLLTYPETEAVLSVGSDSYAVPADLKAWLRVRDGTCRMPGCRAPAERCDIDHSLDWQFGGQTRHDNLAHLCKGCHRLKHHTGWRLRQIGNGLLEWISPTGRVVLTRPDYEMGGAAV